MNLPRRPLLAACAAWGAAATLAPWAGALRATPAGDRVAELLREGGVVLALRHARAPGTFDPPGLDLARCETQRNLDDEGRRQARRLGEWVRGSGLAPAVVRSSPWCRCLDTARGAFGRAEAWAALGSPSGRSPEWRAAQRAELRQALTRVWAQRGRFEAWVTHMFVLQDLTGEGVAEAEALVLRAGSDGSAAVMARATLY
jgi:hypothetical protein